MPAEAESLLPHWKLLTEAAVAATFRPQPAVMDTLKQELLNPGCVDTVDTVLLIICTRVSAGRSAVCDGARAACSPRHAAPRTPAAAPCWWPPRQVTTCTMSALSSSRSLVLSRKRDSLENMC